MINNRFMGVDHIGKQCHQLKESEEKDKVQKTIRPGEKGEPGTTPSPSRDGSQK